MIATSLELRFSQQSARFRCFNSVSSSALKYLLLEPQILQLSHHRENGETRSGIWVAKRGFIEHLEDVGVAVLACILLIPVLSVAWLKSQPSSRYG